MLNSKKRQKSTKKIRIQGAREHNLKNISLELPKEQLIVITGLSGSGKSSLAFDTLYAEGQRRYVESLSAYARQFLELMSKPDIDHIDGLSPAIAIEQKTTSKNPRSTVATVTEIYDYMRLLWARAGTPYSPTTGLPIKSQTISQMVDQAMSIARGQRAYLLAPVIRNRKGEHKNLMAGWLKQGFQRIRINEEILLIENAPVLDKNIKHDIDIVIDRLVLNKGIEDRLSQSLEIALKMTDGIAVLLPLAEKKSEETPSPLIFSEKFSCPESGFSIPEIEPRLFSFNNPFGACSQCDGLGYSLQFDEGLILPEPTLSLLEGAIKPWSKSSSPLYTQTLEALAAHFGFSLKAQWQDLSPKIQSILLYGTKNESLRFVYKDSDRHYESQKPFEGIIPNLQRRWRSTDSSWVREELSRYQSQSACLKCQGKRLKEEALAVKIHKKDISEVTALPIKKARDWFEKAYQNLSPRHQEIASRVLKEIKDRLSFLSDVGLDYLTLNRASGTLSGGEAQRIRLASQIGSGLTGVLYVLDEPSIGLHQRDNARLLGTLKNLKELENTVIVVEHDEDAIRTADHVVDLGPGAGIHGGHIIAQGTPEEIIENKESLTGNYLSGEKKISIPATRRPAKKGRNLTVIGAEGHNLKSVNVTFPLGIFICVTGVSGGGKSTLIIETLYKSAARHLNKATKIPAPSKEIKGFEHLDKVVDIDQSPIGRTPRSNPATYTGAFTYIRDWFSGLPEAKARGYKAGRFSFNVKGGRCEACQGDGVKKIEMHFLPDLYVTCDVCRGNRYNRETLEITYKGKSIADVLDMTVEEGASFFNAIPSIRDKLKTLMRVGLSYIKIGQQATTLSGGEAQRIKLAKELSKRATGKTLYILDEPTTGLHFEDVKKLLEVLQSLVEQGNSMIVIEHNLDVIKTADWVIDLGPEGGDNGGFIVAEGTPETLTTVKESWTGQYLKPLLKRQRK